MTKAELETKPLSDLHVLAAEAGVERYRMLSRAELVGEAGRRRRRGGERPCPRSWSWSRAGGRESESGERAEGGERPARRRRSRGGRRPAGERGERERRDSGAIPAASRGASASPSRRRRPPTPAPAPAADTSSPDSSDSSARPRRRRRRRFGRRSKGELTLQGLLLPPAGRQALLYGRDPRGLHGAAARASPPSSPATPRAPTRSPC